MMHAGGTPSARVELVSSDGQLVVREHARVARLVGDVVAHAVEDLPSATIPLLNVAPRELARLLSYARRAADVDEPGREEVAASLVAAMDVDEGLSDLLLAANYVDNAPLLRAASRRVGEAITGKTVQEIRDMLGLASDMTEEEEEEVRRENAWAFGA